MYLELRYFTEHCHQQCMIKKIFRRQKNCHSSLRDLKMLPYFSHIFFSLIIMEFISSAVSGT